MALDKIDAILARLTALPVELDQFAQSLMSSTAVHDLVIDQNIEQLQKGQRADGTMIDPEYAPATVRMKRRKGRPVDIVTLYDEGHYYDGIKVRNYPTRMEIFDDDPKANDLAQKYGHEIIGLSFSGKMVIRNYIRPILINKGKSLIL